MSSRCQGTRSSTSSIPPRSPTPCATSMASCTWRPGSARSSRSRGSGRVARERSASRGRFEDPRRRGDRGRGGGLRPAHRHVRLPAGRPGLRGHADRRGHADPALRARRRAADRALRARRWTRRRPAIRTARRPGHRQRRAEGATSAPRCTSPMPGARSSRRSRCPAASTTSAVTESASRPSASRGAAGWHPQRLRGATRHDHHPDHRAPEPLRPAAVAAPPWRPRCCFRTPGTWRRREPWSRPDFPWSRPPAGAWPARSAMRTTTVRRPTRCSPRPRESHGASRCP